MTGRPVPGVGAELLAPLEVLPALREGIDASINMAAGPDEAAVAELGRLGATRITFGPKMQQHAIEAVGEFALGLLVSTD